MALTASSCKLLRRSRGRLGVHLAGSNRHARSWRHESPRSERVAPRRTRESPSPAPPPGPRGPQKRTLRSATLAVCAYQCAARQAASAQRRTEKGRCFEFFSSHCSVRLLEPICGIPAFVKSQSASLLGKVVRGMKREKERGKRSCLQCSGSTAQENLKTKGPCRIEIRSPQEQK